jgi:hypothetical protein
MTRNGFMLMSCSKVMFGVIHPFIVDEYLSVGELVDGS